jgi:hypothetical protein
MMTSIHFRNKKTYRLKAYMVQSIDVKTGEILLMQKNNRIRQPVYR